MQKTSKGWVFKLIQLFLYGKRHGQYCHDTIKCHVTQANETNNKPSQSNQGGPQVKKIAPKIMKGKNAV